MPEGELISVVDDDESVRGALRELMRSLGLVAQVYGSAEQFLVSDGVHTSACLIADVQLPRLSGLELYFQLLARGSRIPTILITAYPDESVRDRALRAGVIGYLVKPFDNDELIAGVRRGLSFTSP
jgi:FixJ family two-component response regulator